MRDLERYAIECMEELDKLNIEYGNVISIEVNTRAKRRWGLCRKEANGYKININADLLDERNNVKALKNTIIHELLHTCKGCMNHGKEWKRLASIVNRAYGYDISRCASADDKGVEYRREIAKKERKYAIKCNCCGKVISREKMSKVIQHPEAYRCGFCGGDLIRIA